MNIDDLKTLHFNLARFALESDDNGYCDAYRKKRAEAIQTVLEALIMDVETLEINESYTYK